MAGTEARIIIAFFVFIALPSFDFLPIADESEVEVNGRSQLELGDKFQGDMILTPRQKEMLSGNGKGARLSNYIATWMNAIVPYNIDNSLCKIMLK
jgi:hypothetical protein